MNRAFPGNPRGTISARIASFVKNVIFPLGRVVIDIHAGGKEGAFPLCASFHPIPDPAQRAEIATVSRLFDTPFAFIYASTMASGLLTDEAEAEGKITIGGEFGCGEATNRSGVRHAYEGVRNVLKHYGQLDGEVVPIRPAGGAPAEENQRLDHTLTTCTSVTGFFPWLACRVRRTARREAALTAASLPARDSPGQPGGRRSCRRVKPGCGPG